ncbi:30S ribosomal S17P protein [Fusarium beomiforme]|uniref:30S ribosomal S17P protein n=1 Tax=Fusarium beomiforme TaxID=44412 RepID=A0A9P5DS09_9HYPO|nr:30S ribosomal S17P protein [Fusarium beomiforme]
MLSRSCLWLVVNIQFRFNHILNILVTEAIQLSWEVYNASRSDYERARAAKNIATKLIARTRTSSKSSKDDIQQAINDFRIALHITPPNLLELWIDRVLDLTSKRKCDKASQQLAIQAHQLLHLLVAQIEGSKLSFDGREGEDDNPSSAAGHQTYPERSPELAEQLEELAEVYRMQYLESRDLVDFHAAFKHAKMAIGANYFRSNVNQQPRMAISLMKLLEERYRQLGSLGDLQSSIKLAVETAMHAQSCFSYSNLTKIMFIAILASICVVLNAKHIMVSHESGLERQITVATITTRSAEEGDQQRPIAFHSLSLTLRKRFHMAPDEEKRARSQDIDKAIEAGTIVVLLSRLVPLRDAQLAISLAHSSIAMFQSFSQV